MELKEIFGQALKLERDGQEFYTKMAEYFDEAAVVAMFKQLAKDEAVHYAYIERVYEALCAQDVDIPFSWSEIPEPDVAPEGEEPEDEAPEGDVPFSWSEIPEPDVAPEGEEPEDEAPEGDVPFSWSEIPEPDSIGEGSVSFSITGCEPAETIAELDAVSLIFPRGAQALEVLPENPTEEDALLFALDIEDKSFTLYRNSAEQVQNEEAQKLFLDLANAERTHFEVLMQRYESRFSYPR
ncbi:MAG: ferritin family protein [Anaerolineae bacterium]|nr:ferritin family protein [Anaerolineae bacterium]